MNHDRRAELRKRVLASFEAAFGEAPELLIAAPGRVNLIGEHTDYNDGFVLPCAIDYETIVAISPAEGSGISVVAGDYDDARDQFDSADSYEVQAEEWKNHLRAVAASFAVRGHALGGANIVVAGNVPQGAGLSSSASLGVALAKAFAELSGIDQIETVGLALIAQQAENDFVGTACGIMDQLVSAQAIEGAALMIDCRTLETKPIAFPAEWSIVVIHSGIQRELASSAFNERRAQCEVAAARFGVRSLRYLSQDQLLAKSGELDDIIFRRARHVVSENTRVLEAVEAIAARNMLRLSELMAASHHSLKADFEVTVPAVDRLVGIISDFLGDAGGIRMTGGGFGGCVVVILNSSNVQNLRHYLDKKYETPGGKMADIFVCRLSPGVSVL